MNLFVFQGGKPFTLKYQGNLPEEVHSAWVLFGKTTLVEVTKIRKKFLSGLEIPRMYINLIVMCFYGIIHADNTVNNLYIYMYPSEIMALLMSLNTIAK